MNSSLALPIPVLPSLPSILQRSENLQTKKYICHQWVARQWNNSDWPDRNKCLCRRSRRHTVGCRKLDRENLTWKWWKGKHQYFINPVSGKFHDVWIQIIWEQGKKNADLFLCTYFILGNIVIGFWFPGAHEERIQQAFSKSLLSPGEKVAKKWIDGLPLIHNDGFISPRYYFSSWMIGFPHLNSDCFLKMKKITEAI